MGRDIPLSSDMTIYSLPSFWYIVLALIRAFCANVSPSSMMSNSPKISEKATTSSLHISLNSLNLPLFDVAKTIFIIVCPFGINFIVFSLNIKLW